MPGVVVPTAREKKDPLAQLAQGLQIASSVYGIKSGMAADERAEKRDALADEDRARALASEDDAKRGVLTPMQRAAMQKDFEEVPEGTPGAIPAYVRDANGQESPLFMRVRGKAPAPKKEMTKVATTKNGKSGTVVKYNDGTEDFFDAAPSTADHSGSWVSTGQVDEQGHLISQNTKTGEQRVGTIVGKKAGAEAPEHKAAGAVAANFEGDYAKKTQIVSVIDRELQKFEEFVKNGDTDGAARHGQGMLKALNSAFGADAVGKDEADRLGGYLKPFKAPWEPGSMMHRDLDLFAEQVRAKADALRGAAADSLAQAERIREGGLKAAGGGQSPDVSPKQTQAPGDAFAAPTGTSEDPSAALEKAREEMRKRGLLKPDDTPDRPGKGRRG